MPSPSTRLIGYDLARAFAVLGMVVVNYSSIMEVSVFSPAWLEPLVDFIYGRAAVIFVMLAGISVSLMAGGKSGLPAMQSLKIRLVKRSLLLLLTGLVLWRWWDADILHFYAVFIAVGAWTMTWSGASLRLLTATIFIVSLPVSAALTSAYDSGDTILTTDSSGACLRLLLDFVTSRYYAVFPWLGYFLAGMLLGRRKPVQGAFSSRMGIMGAAVCLGVEICSAVLTGWAERMDWEIEGNWQAAFIRSEAFPVTPLFILSAGASAVAMISLCRAVSDRISAKTWPISALAAFGRLSLTLYVAHIGWGMLFRHWMGASCAGLSSSQMLLAAGIFDLSALLFAVTWCRYFQRGPLEMIFHRLTAGTVIRRPLPPPDPMRMRSGG